MTKGFLGLEVSDAAMLDIKNEIKELKKQMPQAFLRAVYDESVRIFDESQERVPVDTGDLRSSARMNAPKMSAPEIEISYDTTRANERDYALAVHEGYGKNFQHGKEAGYLINAYNAVVDDQLESRLAQATMENFESNKGIRGLKGRKGKKGPLAKKG